MEMINVKQEECESDGSMFDYKLEPIEMVDVPMDNNFEFEDCYTNVKKEPLEIIYVKAKEEEVHIEDDQNVDRNKTEPLDVSEEQFSKVFVQPKTNAQICREYRMRKKAQKLSTVPIKKAMTSAERSRLYRQRRKNKKMSVNQIKLLNQGSSNALADPESLPKSVNITGDHVDDNLHNTFLSPLAHDQELKFGGKCQRIREEDKDKQIGIPILKKLKGTLEKRSTRSNHSIKIGIEVNTIHKIPVINNNVIEKKIVDISKKIEKKIGGKTFKCYVCEKCFKFNSSLNAHIRTHAKPYKCEICEKPFSQKNSLESHVRTHTGEKPFQCDVCKKSFAQKTVLIKHARLHSRDKPYKCDKCHKSFIKENSLIEHARVHTRDKSIKCDMCERYFSCRNHLTIHIRTHTGERPYKCDICNKSFSYKNVLNDHSRIHTGLKPYKCHICSKSFSYKNVLKDHIRMHTGEKPFKCNICDKHFSQKSSLNTHNRVHLREKSYKCHLCDKGFNYKSVLDRHIQSIHGDSVTGSVSD